MPVLNFLFQQQVLLGLLVASCLFVPWDQRRRYFPLRLIAWVLLQVVLPRHISLPLSWPYLLLDTVLVWLMVWSYFDCSPVQALFSTTCAYCVQHITSKLAYIVLVRLSYHGFIQQSPLVLLLILLLANILVCIPVVFWFTRHFLQESRLFFDSISTVIYSGLFFFVAVYLSTILESHLDAAAESYLESYTALNCFCILFAAAILALEFNNSSMKQLESEKRVLVHLLESDKLQYEQAKQDMEKINIRYHDLKQQYSRADDEERTKLDAEMNALNLRYFTDNKALDIVLTQKALICQHAQIQFVCSADGTCLAGMKHYHIYSLLGNAIDNAIECLSQVEDPEKKVIDLDIRRRNDMAVIRIENYTPTAPVLQDGAIVTTKRDPSGHGYGLKSIRNIAEQYGGTADCFVEDSVFCLLVTFPCAALQSQSGENPAN